MGLHNDMYYPSFGSMKQQKQSYPYKEQEYDWSDDEDDKYYNSSNYMQIRKPYGYPDQPNQYDSMTMQNQWSRGHSDQVSGWDNMMMRDNKYQSGYGHYGQHHMSSHDSANFSSNSSSMFRANGGYGGANGMQHDDYYSYMKNGTAGMEQPSHMLSGFGPTQHIIDDSSKFYGQRPPWPANNYYGRNTTTATHDMWNSKSLDD